MSDLVGNPKNRFSHDITCLFVSVTRSGRVRKKPAKFTDVAVEEEEEDPTPAAPVPLKSVPSTPVAPKSAHSTGASKSPIKTEPLSSPVPLTFQSPVAARGKSRVTAVPVTPIQVDIKSEVLSTSPDSAEDVGKPSSRGGRVSMFELQLKRTLQKTTLM